MYLLWAYLPSPFLHQLGIYYYPNRWWALALPAWLVMGIVYIYVALASYNTGYLTLPLSSCENLVDEAANIAIVDAKGRIIRQSRTRKAAGAGNAEHHHSGGGVGGSGRRGLGPGLNGGHSRNNSASKLMGLAGAAGVQHHDWNTLWSEGTDAVMDVPIGGVCEILYGAGRDRLGDADGIPEDVQVKDSPVYAENGKPH